MEKRFEVMLKALLIGSVFILGYILWYLFLPALNLKSVGFWFYGIIMLGYICFIVSFLNESYLKHAASVFVVAMVLFISFGIFSSKIFNSKQYANLISMSDGEFNKDIKEISFEQIPKVDRDTAVRLGDRQMGGMLDLVSQFNVSDEYTQINQGKKPVRVTPLIYNGFLKWINNKNEGIPGYIVVDMVNGDARLQKLDEGIKYSKSDRFSRDIVRHLRYRYPTAIFREINFEINDEGIPFWIAPIYESKVGLFGGKDVDNVVLVNAINGEHSLYPISDVPEWVDKVFDADNIINQLNWNGTLHSGFLNSIFSQRGVLKTTEGYNYLAVNNDVHLYTGITSIGKDESNVGFVLVNLRTKETKFYKVSSAEEYSAMESSEGAVQEKEYKATFPILLNIEGKATYFMSLKDGAGLIKMYAFVDAENYQKVSIGETVEKALEVHLGKEIKGSKDANLVEKDEVYDIVNIKDRITDIKEVTIDGNSHYYILLDSLDIVMVANINAYNRLPFLREGDNVVVEYYSNKDINIITSIKLAE